MPLTQSTLEIRNWQDELVPVYKTKAQLYDYFTTKYDQSTLSKDLNSLRYLDDEAEMDCRKLEMKFKLNPCEIVLPKENEEFIKKWVEPYRLDGFYGSTPIVTFSNVITKIMNTPFEINNETRRWTIRAICKDNVIQLIDNQNNPSSTRCYELLKRHLFLTKPLHDNRNITSKMDNLFYEIYQMKIGENNLMYAVEIAGVKSEQKLTKFEELASAEHVFCASFFHTHLSKEVINYNPQWWSGGELFNAKQYCIGCFNSDNNSIQDFYKFNTDRFNDITNYSNLWSQIGAWNFLDKFLGFVKTEIGRIKPEYRNICHWKFQSCDGGKPIVTCETYKYERNCASLVESLHYK